MVQNGRFFRQSRKACIRRNVRSKPSILTHRRSLLSRARSCRALLFGQRISSRKGPADSNIPKLTEYSSLITRRRRRWHRGESFKLYRLRLQARGLWQLFRRRAWNGSSKIFITGARFRFKRLTALTRSLSIPTDRQEPSKGFHSFAQVPVICRSQTLRQALPFMYVGTGFKPRLRKGGLL